MVALVQTVLTAVLFASLPAWKGRNAGKTNPEAPATALGLPQVLNIRGVKYILLAFFSYCALESTTGLWASSYLVKYRGIDSETAAKFASLFFLGITFGRFLCGFIADQIGDRLLIRYGIIILICGIILVGLPGTGNSIALAGLVMIGLGCAPVYPSIIHATPSNFGQENSQAIIGMQMASAYTGSTFMPPLFGFMAEKTSIGLYPFYLMFFALLMVTMTEMLNKRIKVQA